MAYDYIIVGTGAGGSVLAEKLSRNGKYSILVLEAGGSDWNPMHLVPKGFYFTMQDPRNTKFYKTESFGNATVETWQRGWVTGGSTTINGMVWNRGDASFYDSWEANGNKNWNYSRFLNAWRDIENHQLGSSPNRGGSGPVHVEIANAKTEVGDAMIAALGAKGVPFVEDMNESGADRVSIVASNTKHGFRQSAAAAFLRPARKRKNVTFINKAEVNRVIFNGVRAVGVEAEIDGKMEQFSASREVLVCGGALESPLLLERSGIGARDVLENAGVEVLVDLPGVGENLSEHRGIMLQLRFDGTVGFNHLINSPIRQLVTGAKFLLQRTGVISFGGYEVLGMFRTAEDAEDVDTQLFFTPVSTAGSNPLTGEMKVDKFSGAMMIGYPMHPTSRGSIHITGPLAAHAPKIIPNYLDTDYDREMVLKVTRKLRSLVASPELQALGAEEIQPGLDKIASDEEILDYSLNSGASGYHTLGTCRIGHDDLAVVDDRLRVHGVQGLRVVDASVFPSQPSGNNNAPTQAAAWIAADMILEDAEA